MDNVLPSYAIPGNDLRKQLGLPLIVYKNTKCLSCQEVFLSKNYPHIRVCQECKRHLDQRVGLNIFDEPQQILSSCTKNKTPVEVNWSDLSETMSENILDTETLTPKK